MKIIDRPFPGAALIALEPAIDERGSFARLYDRDFFLREGFDAELDHVAESINPVPLTLRGLHFQKPPYHEQKLIRCSKGSIFDVAVDLRRGSPTEGKVFHVVLNDQDARALLLPKGIAHGFLTLDDHSRVLYHLFQPYHAASSSGLRFDDPALAIPWPSAPRLINPRDSSWPLLHELPLTDRAAYA